MQQLSYSSFLAALCAGLSLAQNPADAGAAKERPIKLLNLGVAVSYYPISYLENKTRDTTLSDTTTFSSKNESLAGRLGLSPEVHAHFLGRWGLASGVHFRGGDFRLTNTTTITTTAGTTTTTKTSSTKERTSFRSLEVPFLVRRFNMQHNETGGLRWFYQGGVSMRHVYGVRSERSSTATDGTVTCCNETPAVPRRVNTVGFTTGAGLTSRDGFGIRVTPEIRYTRWFGGPWDNLAARTSRNQLELMVGFYF